MTRFLTGLVGVLVFIAALWLWTPVIQIVILAFIALALYEMYRVMSTSGLKPVPCGGFLAAALLWPGYALLGWQGMVFALLIGMMVTIAWPDNITRSFADVGASLMALLYPLLPMACLLFATLLPAAEGRLVVGWGLGMSFLTDTSAYFTGKSFGKHKLSPRISPKKTVEGSVGAVVCCMLAAIPAGLVLQGMYTGTRWYMYVVLALLCSLAAQAGDLTASTIKRLLGVKDFGNLLPGHGGVLDRFDSIMFSLPVTYLVVTLFMLWSPLVV